MVQTMTSFVRVTGIRSGKFVEFEFALGDSDLSVELIMPFTAFEEFCRRQEAVVLPMADGVYVPAASAPGLYRRPDARDVPNTH
ncbi:MAG TPA: phenol hydroxylase subunit [Azospirillum sp.]|nr:phenol hydroxylase subunit [Azospirillum sp.]